ncbi:MAG: lysophospholipid acyltransferase family protein [Acidobacteriota bacterium]
MSDPGTLPRDVPAARAKPAAMVLPLWSINLLRPVIGLVSRVFWHLEFKGLENIPRSGGVIIASNHQSYVDPAWVGLPIRRSIRFLAWSEAFSWPVVGKAIQLLGAWPLQVEGSDPAAIRRSLTWLRNGGVVVIFPEGGRGLPDGSLVRMKGGAVRMALEAGVPILPVTIRGANRVWPPHRRVPRTGKVEIIYHPIIHVVQHPGEETRACARRETDRLSAIIGSVLKAS